ncbi:MAG: division/cell wall cluster transcriptional repressor MraZ [Clostridiaceae bacterium]|jgi:MraZ protein|nr:division/cell wall cluster transcriptional repressor MraZ [Clostridiaceae bacterium]
MARYTHTIDQKGRVIVPVKLREQLDGVLVVTESVDDGFLAAYTVDQFEELKSKIMSLSATDVSVRLLRRRILGSANVCEFDAQGRIMVPAFLWEHIGVQPGEEVCFIDVFSKIEICSSAFFEQHMQVSESLADMDLSKYDIPGL